MNGFPDRRYFGHVATATGFRVGPLETVFRLIELLGRIDERLGDEVLLRGGTALNLLHLDLPRLSVDLDLDYVGAAGADEAQRRRPEVLATLEALGGSAGYDVTEERPSYAMAHLRLAYVDVDGRPAFLKMDVNFLDRVPVLPPVRLSVRHPFGDDLRESAVQTLTLDELAAAKTVALVRRTLARDLFDVAMLSALPDLDDELVRVALVVRGAGYPPPSPAEYAPDVVERIRRVQWRSEVLALARRPVPFSFDTAKSQAALFLLRATSLHEDHREFLRQLELGELRPELLGARAIRERIAQNPAVLWRLRSGDAALEER